MTLKSEITSDPLSRGYAGMTDRQIVDSLNAPNRSRNRTSMTGDELFASTDATQYAALSTSDKLLWVSFCGRSEIAPFGAANVAFVTSLFGAASPTLVALAASRRDTISRAEELGLGEVKGSAVVTARAV